MLRSLIGAVEPERGDLLLKSYTQIRWLLLLVANGVSLIIRGHEYDCNNHYALLQ